MFSTLSRKYALLGLVVMLLQFFAIAARAQEATPSPVGEAIDRLRGPMNLPAVAEGEACPRSDGERVSPAFGFALGEGPVYASNLGPDGVSNYGGGREEGGWYYLKVLWIGDANYTGPVLIRGGRIDGPGELRFDKGSNPAQELFFPSGEGGSTSDDPGWRHWPSYARVQEPGCYAFQVDGDGFSEIVVILAVEEKPEELTPIPLTGLPMGLAVGSAFELESGAVRLDLTGDKHLVLRLDVFPTSSEPLQLQETETRELETSAGTVLWSPDSENGWPRYAVWDDGNRRYSLEVLDAQSDAWSESSLGDLVEVFAAASE